MKLAKLSLATIVAVGAMTTIASATPLEEAIKGVELNGFIRYRYYHESDAVYDDGGHERNRFSAPFTFTIPVAENLKAGVTLRYEGDDFTQNSGIGNGDFSMTKAWFQYGVDGFSVKAGKFEILSPWTFTDYPESRGDGVLALYTGVPGWTFGVGGFLGTNLNPQVAGILGANGHVVAVDELTEANIDISQENLYAIAALGALGPVNIQLWAASMEHVFDYTFFGDLQFAMGGFSAQLQASTLKLADETNIFRDDTGVYFGGKVGYEVAGFSAEVGYTKNDDDQPIYTLANDDSDGYIFFGEQLGAATANVADSEVIFIDLGYGIGDFALGAGYGHLEAFNNVEADEWYVGAQYDYSKNFNLKAVYSSFDVDDTDDGDNNEIKFEAKYSF